MFKLKYLIPFLALTFGSAFAQPGSQRIFEIDAAPDLHCTWVVVDDFPQKEEAAQEALRQAALHTRQILDRLDPLNPVSEIALLLAKKEAGTFPISPELAQILYTTQQIAKQMGEPLARKIKVDREKNEVKLRSPDVIINIEPLLKGFLADQMMQSLEQAGFSNSFLNVEEIFVARGRDFNGPWKIRVVDQTTANAQHAFLYTASDTAAATVSFDQRGMALPSADLKSVTIFTKESASEAQGLAAAAYAMGLTNAKKFLEDLEIERAVLIDTDGRFHQVPEEDKK